MKKITIVPLAIVTAISGSLPASSAPIMVERSLVARAVSVVNVQYRDEIPRWERENRREMRRPPLRGGWHNGYEGFREQRHGYRRHSDGWWYPLAAFGAGVGIGATRSDRPVHSRLANQADPRHFDWCFARYRTYRAYDNTYVPRAGVRAECISPFLSPF